MHEIEQDFEEYFPQLPILQQVGHVRDKHNILYKSGNVLDNLLERTVECIARGLEQVHRPLYSFRDQPFFLSSEWKRIVRVLSVEKIIAEQKIFFDPPLNDEPKFFMARFILSCNDMLLEAGNQVHNTPTWGASFDFDEAISKAIGETLERFGLLHFRTINTIKATTAFLAKSSKAFLHPRELAGFSDEQRNKNRQRYWNENSVIRWVKGKCLSDGKTVLLPAQLVFWNYASREKPTEPLMRESNTNGEAGMFTTEGAILAGIKELIQREGFLIYWLNTVAPPRIDLGTIDDEDVQKLLSSIHRYGFRAEVLDTTTDIGVPAFTGVVIDESNGKKRICVGGGAGYDMPRAISSALFEALMLLHTTRKREDYFSLPDYYQPFSDPTVGHRERLMLWAKTEKFSDFQWFINGKISSLKDLQIRVDPTNCGKAKELDLITERLSRLGQGYEIYYYESKHPIFEKLGYHAVKVIIPEIVPLYLFEDNAPLGSKRLWEVPEKLRFHGMQFPNPLPHPFP